MARVACLVKDGAAVRAAARNALLRRSVVAIVTLDWFLSSDVVYLLIGDCSQTLEIEALEAGSSVHISGAWITSSRTSYRRNCCLVCASGSYK